MEGDGDDRVPGVNGGDKLSNNGKPPLSFASDNKLALKNTCVRSGYLTHLMTSAPAMTKSTPLPAEQTDVSYVMFRFIFRLHSEPRVTHT